MHSNGSYHTSDDENSPVLKDLTAPDSFIDEHERTATRALTTTSRQETQRLHDEITKLYDSLGHLRARLTEVETGSSGEPSRRAVDKVAKIQRDLYAIEAKLKERNTAEQLLSSAIQAAGTSDTILQMKTVFKSYQHETQQNYAVPIASLKTALIRAQEEAAGLDTARLAATQAKKDVEHNIAEAKKRIRMYEKRLRLWSAYGGIICLGPENLGRLLGNFPGVEGILRTACVELDLNGPGVVGEDDRGSGSA
jgi:chromosome segregation ATPase